MDPDSEDTVQQFGKLLCISANPNNSILHWQLINTPTKQMLTLQCIRNVLFNVNIQHNKHPDMDKIKNADANAQMAHLSALASKICKNRRTHHSNKDEYWVTNRKQWGFCGELINDARKLHMAIGTVNKKVFKYGCGKRLLHRTNWDIQAVQFVGDMNKPKQKTLCRKINNLKCAYELQISECVIVAHFESIIALFDKLQTFIKFSKKLDVFCKTLALTNTVEFNENLLAMYKKTEIAIAGAHRSISEFRLDTMKLKRDLLNWWTLIKHSPNTLRSKKLESTLKNDISTLNLITNGELRGSDQRREKLTNCLIKKYQNGPKPTITTTTPTNANTNTTTNTNNQNPNQITPTTKNQITSTTKKTISNKRRKLNKPTNQSNSSFDTVSEALNQDNNDINSSAMHYAKIFDNARIFNTN